jgi:hypothetical protein
MDLALVQHMAETRLLVYIVLNDQLLLSHQNNRLTCHQCLSLPASVSLRTIIIVDRFNKMSSLICMPV